MGPRRSKLSSAIAAAAAFLACFASSSEGADLFYQGSILRIVVGAPSGSGYDIYSRILAQFLPNYIPGHPTVIVEDMPGAASALAAGYMFNVAPRDGTVIASASDSLPNRALLHPDIVKFDVSKFSWIGSVTRDIYVAYVWHTAPIQSYEDAKQREVVVGGVAIGDPSVDLAAASNALFGTKFKIVSGYNGNPAINLGMERGEIQAAVGTVYSSLKAQAAEWLRDQKVKIVLQGGFEKAADLPNVPLFIDQAKTPADREILNFLLAPQQFQKPFYAPPGIPRDRLDILREAFAKTVADPDFLAAAAKANITVMGPMSGDELTTAITKVARTSPALIERISRIISSMTKAD